MIMQEVNTPKQSQQPNEKHAPLPNKSDHKKHLLIAFVLLLFLIPILMFFLQPKKPLTPAKKQFFPTPTKKSDMYQFPLYPHAVFFRQENAPSCPDQTNEALLCDATLFIYQTTDTVPKVTQWYINNSTLYDWVFEKGSGKFDIQTQSIYKHKKDGRTVILQIAKVSPSDATTITVAFQNPASSWQTYINTSPKFSLKYPKVWQRSDLDFIPPMPKECQPPHVCSGNKPHVQIKLYKNFQNFSLKEYVLHVQLLDGADKQLLDGIMDNFKENSLNTNKNNASLINTKLPSEGSLTEVFFEKDADIVMISFQSIDEKTRDEMIRSFTFL